MMWWKTEHRNKRGFWGGGGGSGCIFLTQRISAFTTEVSKQTNGCVVSIFFPFEQRLVFSARLDQTGVSQTHWDL